MNAFRPALPGASTPIELDLGALLPGVANESSVRRKIPYVTSEMSDVVKSGGLGDVSAALPRSLRSDDDVRVVMPGYRAVTRGRDDVEVVARLEAAHGLRPASSAGSSPRTGSSSIS